MVQHSYIKIYSSDKFTRNAIIVTRHYNTKQDRTWCLLLERKVYQRPNKERYKYIQGDKVRFLYLICSRTLRLSRITHPLQLKL